MTQHAVTSDETLADQADPPYLVEDMAAEWQHDLPTMEVEQRINFAGFLARLVAVGIGIDRLDDLVTTFVRETLQGTDLGSLIATEGKRRYLNPGTIEILWQRLPVTRVLMQYCGHRIVAGRKNIEEVTRWTTLFYAIEACFNEIGSEHAYLAEEARLSGNWVGPFGQMIGIDRVRRPS